MKGFFFPNQLKCRFHFIYLFLLLLYLVFIIHLGLEFYTKIIFLGFPGGAVVENLPANAGDTGSSPGLGRSHMLRSN